MDAVEEEFLLHRPGVLPALRLGDGGADQDLAVVEGDDVGRRRVIEEFPVDATDLRGADEADLDAGGEGSPALGQELNGGLNPTCEGLRPPRLDSALVLQIEKFHRGTGAVAGAAHVWGS